MITEALLKVVEGHDLSEQEMGEVMMRIMEGEADPISLGAFLTALRIKGENVNEIVGAAKVMRKKAVILTVSADPILDTCGTGGDGGNTFNISTAAAFLVSGAGITVAKHGNRAVSSRSGSADVLTCLDINIEAETNRVEQCLQQVGIGFLFAPRMHPAMKNAAEVRKKLGYRTIFNLLGPLTNPAGAHAQVIGVYDLQWTLPLAQVLKKMGSRHAFVVHGEDGLDEISLAAPTHISELKKGEINNYMIEPEQFGMQRCQAEDLKGGSPEDNATIIRNILRGEKGPKRDIVVLNAAAAIAAAGKAENLESALVLARESIDSGAALQKLTALIHVSNS
ncbi:MAG: anthranilate phosphoribosyltransferase [Nitrospinota bacterium]|nr:anthranilate phosphoribosyltransferase [Nitrospinota bacterium]